MQTVTQPTINPTNKLTAATIAAAAVEIGAIILQNVAPSWYSDELKAAILPLAVFAAGWIVKDRPNV